MKTQSFAYPKKMRRQQSLLKSYMFWNPGRNRILHREKRILLMQRVVIGIRGILCYAFLP